jgi:O-antigen/teichoic acid export membrane protein
MKATSLFGGVQVFQIIIQIIRSKFIALLLGPAGMGIAGLLNSTIGLIGALTEFGLGASAVKNVAAANSTGSQTRIAIVITVLRRWVWITGLLGMLVTIVIAPILSRLTFGNSEYTFPFIWISISLLFMQLSNGQMVILQGLRKLQYLAKANLTGSALGLIITVPLYYLLGIKGIVPAIIISSFVSMLRSWYFARKIKIEKVKVSKVRTIAEGKEMLTMGFMISLSGLITIGTSYIMRIFISRNGGVTDVGLYNAGFAIITTYVGMIFTAMATDYYPRLAAVSNNNEQSNQAINHQAEIALLILAPVIIIFLVFINWVVIFLYSAKFIAINNMILWAALGMLFKAASWPIGFLFLARGASKVFFWSELTANAYILLLNILGYKYYGLEGLGISFMIGYILVLLQVYFITNIKYNFSFNNEFYKIFSFQLFLAVLCFIVVKLVGGPFSYIFGSLIIVASGMHSYKQLDKRLGIKNIFQNIFKKNNQ